MSATAPSDRSSILETVIQWPSESRLWLLQELAKSLQPAIKPDQNRGRPVDELVGIGSGEGAAPDDDQVRVWLDEYRLGKHG